MADEIDKAADHNELLLTCALSHRKPTLRSTGKCHWCDETVPENAHFCDSDCRDDFEQYKRRNGGF